LSGNREIQNVALYKYGNYLTQSGDGSFEIDHGPGATAPFAGIYRCMGCHQEIGIAQGHVLPPENHHTHTQQQGAIRWRMIVFANPNSK
jgi:hypothetical protein